MGKKIITLVTEAQAKPGLVFRPSRLEACSRCKLRKVCIENVREGLLYRVVKVRDVKHTCIATGATMVVVEVEPAEFKALVPIRVAVRGMTWSFHPPRCSRRTCKYREYCRPPALRRGDKVEIIQVLSGDLKCPQGYTFKLVLLRPLF